MAPNRYAEVTAICESHPAAFPQDATNDTGRLLLLIGTIIPALNVRDGGDWGYLTKTDQHDKVPCDVLVWRPTREVIDCMTGTGACWIVHDPPPPAWVWTPVLGPPDPPDPAPPDASVPVFYGVLTAVGTIVPQPNGFVVLIGPNGSVRSVPPNGQLEWRAPGTVGAWELATRVGNNLLRYDGTGSVYYVAVQAR
jgi:hypothetical protein